MKFWIDGDGQFSGYEGQIIGAACDQVTGEMGYQVEAPGGGVELVAPDLVRPINPLPLMVPGVATEQGLFLEGMQYQEPATFKVSTRAPRLDEVIQIASGDPVVRQEGRFVDLSTGQDLGGRFDLAYMEATEGRTPDMAFLESIPAQLGRILRRKQKGKTLAEMVQDLDQDQFSAAVSSWNKRTIREAGYGSPEEFWIDADRLVRNLPRLNPPPAAPDLAPGLEGVFFNPRGLGTAGDRALSVLKERQIAAGSMEEWIPYTSIQDQYGGFQKKTFDALARKGFVEVLGDSVRLGDRAQLSRVQRGWLFDYAGQKANKELKDLDPILRQLQLKMSDPDQFARLAPAEQQEIYRSWQSFNDRKNNIQADIGRRRFVEARRKADDLKGDIFSALSAFRPLYESTRPVFGSRPGQQELSLPLQLKMGRLPPPAAPVQKKVVRGGQQLGFFDPVGVEEAPGWRGDPRFEPLPGQQTIPGVFMARPEYVQDLVDEWALYWDIMKNLVQSGFPYVQSLPEELEEEHLDLVVVGGALKDKFRKALRFDRLGSITEEDIQRMEQATRQLAAEIDSLNGVGLLAELQENPRRVKVLPGQMGLFPRGEALSPVEAPEIKPFDPVAESRSPSGLRQVHITEAPAYQEYQQREADPWSITVLLDNLKKLAYYIDNAEGWDLDWRAGEYLEEMRNDFNTVGGDASDLIAAWDAGQKITEGDVQQALLGINKEIEGAEEFLNNWTDFFQEEQYWRRGYRRGSDFIWSEEPWRESEFFDYTDVLKKKNPIAWRKLNQAARPGARLPGWLTDPKNKEEEEKRRAFLYGFPVDVRGGTIVQSLAFPKSWSKDRREKWLKRRGYKVKFRGKGPEFTKNFVRYRQTDPGRIDPESYGTIEFGESGILATVGLREERLPEPIRRDNPTSAATARSQVPALFKRFEWRPGAVNLDIGGGPYDKGTEYLYNQGVSSFVVDPYNRSPEDNQAALSAIRQAGGADTVTATNVLNVIDNPGDRRQVLENAAGALAPGGVALFSIYEGDRTGRGLASGSDSYQANKKTAAFVPEVKKVFSSVERKGNIIIASEPKTINPLQEDLFAPSDLEARIRRDIRKVREVKEADPFYSGVKILQDVLGFDLAWAGLERGYIDDGGLTWGKTPAEVIRNYHKFFAGAPDPSRRIYTKEEKAAMRQEEAPPEQIRLFNPVQTVRIVGVKPRPFNALIDTEGGTVLKSPGFRSYVGVPMGAGELIDMEQVVQRERARRDFRSVDDAWRQFEEWNSTLAGELDRGGSGPYVSSAFVDRDSTGALFDDVRVHYERRKPIQTLEEAVKYMIRKEKIKRWEDFPLWILQQNPTYEWLQLPLSDEVLARSMAAPSDQEVQLHEQEMFEAGARFNNLWFVRNYLEFYKTKMKPSRYRALMDAWLQLLPDKEAPGALLMGLKEQIDIAAGNVEPPPEQEEAGDVPF